MSFVQKAILLLNIFAGFVLALAFVSPKVRPDITVIPSILGGIFPVLLAVHLIFIVYWLLTKWQWSFISLVLLFLGWQHVYSFVGINKSNQVEDQITVSTFNTFGFREYRLGDNRKRASIEKEVSNLLAQDLDLLCLQEYNSQVRKVFNGQGAEKFAYDYAKNGVKIYSKLPITDKGSFDFNSSINSCAWVDIVFKGDSLRVYCIHLNSNRVSQTAEDIVSNSDLSEKETWLSIRKIMARYKQAAIRRKEESNVIKTHAASGGLPYIIAGDANDHPLSWTYSVLRDGLKDSFVDRGQGIGTTYDGSIPFLRIDYILADPTFDIMEHRIIPMISSDHHAVLSRLSLDGK